MVAAAAVAVAVVMAPALAVASVEALVVTMGWFSETLVFDYPAPGSRGFSA